MLCSKYYLAFLLLLLKKSCLRQSPSKSQVKANIKIEVSIYARHTKNLNSNLAFYATETFIFWPT